MPTEFRYPIYDLEASLEPAALVDEKGGGPASIRELAEYLGYKSTQNGAFISRLAATRLFGFMEGHASALSVTPRARAILQPEYPETAARARLEAFLAVPLYRAFLDRYEGMVLPPPSGMENALVNQFGVPAKRAHMVLSRLLDSADQAGLFRVAGSRSKLIVPTIAAGSITRENGEEPEVPRGLAAIPMPEPREAQRYPKLIEGLLELLPKGTTWGEDDMQEWLALFQGVLRVQYGLPRKRGGPNAAAKQE